MTPPGIPSALPVARIVVWRHGRTAWNESGRFQGQQDPPLVDAGRSEAVRAARALVAAGLTAEDTVVVTSDLVRAVDTATALTDLLGTRPLVDARLREHGLGSWEGLTRVEVAERFPEQYADWQSGRAVRGRGGEDPDDVATRAIAALRDLPSAGTAVAVTHAATSGRLVESLLGLGADHRRVLGPLGNCAWSELRAEGSRWRLMRHNTTAAMSEGAAAQGVPARPGDGGRPLRADDAEAAG